MVEAASRQAIDQVVGTDDPTALAVATAATDNVLIGEELFATSAYLEGSASQVASLQLQDILRWIVVLFIWERPFTSWCSGNGRSGHSA
jgi:hypothetical protein